MIQRYIVKYRILLFDALLTLCALYLFLADLVHHRSILFLAVDMASYMAMIAVVASDIQGKRGTSDHTRVRSSVRQGILYTFFMLYLAVFITSVVAAVK